MTKPRVVLGLSGGVDSAVAAVLLLEAGYEPYAVTLRLWPPAAETALSAAQAVAEHLHLPWRTVDLSERFRQRIVEPFIEAYSTGRTPNPCVLCNPQVKLWALLAEANRLGAQWIATGHYARLRREADGTVHLLAGRDPRRDQSYFLYRLPQSMLRRLLLPLGEMRSKAEVRALARDRALPLVAERRDSQDLCFIAGGDYRRFLRDRRPDAFRPGPIVTTEGKVVGEHRGLPAYTIGQRKGLGIGSDERLYVVGMEQATRTLIVGPLSALLRETAALEAVVFTAGEPEALPLSLQVRIRHRAPLAAATLEREEEGWRLRFARPQRGLAPGQSAVFYRGEEVIGGGFFAD